MRNRGMRTIGVLAVLLLALPGCGGDDEEAVTSVSAEVDSFSITPDSVTVAADTDIAITVENVNDTDEHEWVIIKPGHEIESEADFDEDDVLFEVDEVAPGTTKSDTFNVPEGEYQVICALSGHFTSGMKAKLVAKST